MEVWFKDTIRGFLASIDGVVYWFIDLLISLFDNLAATRLFDTKLTGAFAERIYFLISIVMIFKVSFSIIQYIINPDSFSDKEKGMGKVVQGIIVTLVALVGVRYVFDFAYELQDSITHSHVLEKVVLGVNNVESENQKNTKSAIPIKILNAVVTVNTTEIGDFTYKYYDKGEIYTYFCGTQPMYKYENGILEYNSGFGGCFPSDTKYKYRYKDGSDLTPDVYETNTGGIYNIAQEKKNYSLLLDLINDKQKETNDVYIFEYKYGLSTVLGVFVAIIYINFCFDLAIRTVKLGFLQLIAPVPIISMVDPKSSKSGMMSKWVKMCINTYLGLFLRIVVVAFAVLVIDLVFSHNPIKSVSGQDVNSFIQIIIMIGALMFAKELPKLISDLTGLDLSGNFKLNPFSRIPGMKGIKTLGGAALTGTVGGIAGAVSAGMAHGQLGHKWWQTTGGIFGGLGRGMASGLGNGFRNHGQHFIRNGMGAAQMQADRVKLQNGTTFGGRLTSRTQQTLGLQTNAQNINEDMQLMKDISGDISALDDYMEKEILKNKGGAYQDVANAKNMLDMIGSVNRDSFMGSNGVFDQAGYENALAAQASRKSQAEANYHSVLDAAKERYLASNRQTNSYISSRIDRVERNTQELNRHGFDFDSTVNMNYNELDQFKKDCNALSNSIELSSEYFSAQRTDEAAKPRNGHGPGPGGNSPRRDGPGGRR